jgi:hypothetical protein
MSENFSSEMEFCEIDPKAKRPQRMMAIMWLVQKWDVRALPDLRAEHTQSTGHRTIVLALEPMLQNSNSAETQFWTNFRPNKQHL